MKQQDLVINNVSVLLNTDESGAWMKDSLIILKKDSTEEEVLNIINYLYEEGFIWDRRIKYEIK
tara:strand:- start:870 stop:1061 length:192 start_codon:yes stop_codon:yes gene_type:complete